MKAFAKTRRYKFNNFRLLGCHCFLTLVKRRKYYENIVTRHALSDGISLADLTIKTYGRDGA